MRDLLMGAQQIERKKYETDETLRSIICCATNDCGLFCKFRIWTG